jgi:hypothetical protein
MNGEPEIRIAVTSAEEMTSKLLAASPPDTGKEISDWTTKQRERLWFCRLFATLPNGPTFPGKVIHDDGPDFVFIEQHSHRRYGIEITEMVSKNYRAVEKMPTYPEEVDGSDDAEGDSSSAGDAQDNHHHSLGNRAQRRRQHVPELFQANGSHLAVAELWRSVLTASIERKTYLFGWESVADECWLLIVDNWHRSFLLSDDELHRELEHIRRTYWKHGERWFDRIFVETHPRHPDARVLYDVRASEIRRYPVSDRWHRMNLEV